VREIIVDTETTGLDRKVDRVVEIGCVEIENRIPTGRTFHQYINPTYPVHKEAFKVHGLSNDFLKIKPTFRRVVNKFLRFIDGARLVIHNAPFDMGMLNEELDRLGMAPLENEVVDTLELAKEKRPRGRHTLDALCSAYDIDNSRRQLHGALLDAELLSEVYVEMLGGLQIGFDLTEDADQPEALAFPAARQRPVPLVRNINPEERIAHEAFVKTLGDQAIWLEYRDPQPETRAA
jgi:DNA polymerase III subunit epsilon